MPPPLSRFLYAPMSSRCRTVARSSRPRCCPSNKGEARSPPSLLATTAPEETPPRRLIAPPLGTVVSKSRRLIGLSPAPRNRRAEEPPSPLSHRLFLPREPSIVVISPEATLMPPLHPGTLFESSRYNSLTYVMQMKCD
jgi:hypothetical protein